MKIKLYKLFFVCGLIFLGGCANNSDRSVAEVAPGPGIGYFEDFNALDNGPGYINFGYGQLEFNLDKMKSVQFASLPPYGGAFGKGILGQRVFSSHEFSIKSGLDVLTCFEGRIEINGTPVTGFIIKIKIRDDGIDLLK